MHKSEFIYSFTHTARGYMWSAVINLATKSVWGWLCELKDSCFSSRLPQITSLGKLDIRFSFIGSQSNEWKKNLFFFLNNVPPNGLASRCLSGIVNNHPAPGFFHHKKKKALKNQNKKSQEEEKLRTRGCQNEIDIKR